MNNNKKTLTKKYIKYIKSLKIKKYADKERVFIVEGEKSVKIFLKSTYTIKMIVATPEFITENAFFLKKYNELIWETDSGMLSTLGNFKKNKTILAVIAMKNNVPIYVNKNEYGLVLDTIQDPGNLGTILRVANFYGIYKVICSLETVSLYNYKSIHASMGSFVDISIFYTDLLIYLQSTTSPILGALVQGDSIHTTQFPKGGLLVIGNESHGIHSNILPYLTQRIGIPKYGKATSLNAAIATGIICDYWRK